MFNHALWELRASYPVCAWRAGREHLIAYLRGDVDQLRRVILEGPPEDPLPAAAHRALAEAAAAMPTGGAGRGAAGRGWAVMANRPGMGFGVLGFGARGHQLAGGRVLPRVSVLG